MVASRRRGSICCQLRQGTWLMKSLWSRPGRSMAFPVFSLLSLVCLVPWAGFHIVKRLIRDSSSSGPSHFVADREVGLRPLPTVLSCCPIVGMSRLDGVREDAQMDVYFPSPLIRA